MSLSIKKVLIANRGEIALRVIRACRELGIRTVAVFSQADSEALHVRFADEAICIGPPPAQASYLNTAALIAAAEISGADAIHPGYGFLAENDAFAATCQKSGLTFIGPPAPLMNLMGDKVRARKAMAEAGVPIVPGSGVVHNAEQALSAAETVGFPVMIKACAGGGGRGMKIVRTEEELIPAWSTARKEAEAAFANPDVYLERYVDNPRHVEIQVMGDTHGNVVYLGERECSIQRRHQKLIEEAPSTVIDEARRRELGGIAVRAAQTIGYQSAGTLEFLMDQHGDCFFMEMNTRIQVEHTVTEEITGFDLVQEQIRIACGEPLSFTQEDIVLRGHAIECRINAEDPVTFAPSPGRITALHLPGGFGVRIDTAIYDGYRVPPNYDSMIAKLIVWAPTRQKCIDRLRRALAEFVVGGIKTNCDLYKRIVDFPDFAAGRLDTGFLTRMQLATQAAEHEKLTLEAAKTGRT